MSGMGKCSRDAWRAADFCVEADVPSKTVCFRPASPLRSIPVLADTRGHLIAPFVCTEVGVDEKRDARKPHRSTWSSESSMMDELVSQLSIEVSQGRELLTVVGGNEDRFSGKRLFPGAFSCEAIPSSRVPLSRRLSVFLGEGRYESAERLWLTQDSPSDIPGYHVRTVVSICPRRGEEVRIRQKLLNGGLCAFSSEDVRACKSFFVPSFYYEGSQREPYVSIIHRVDIADYVRRSVRKVSAGLGFSVHREWRLSNHVVTEWPPEGLARFPRVSPMVPKPLLVEDSSCHIGSFVETSLFIDTLDPVHKTLETLPDEEWRPVADLISSLTVTFSRGRSLLTVINDDETVPDGKVDAVAGDGFEPMAPLKTAFFRRVRPVLTPGKGMRHTSGRLWVTRRSPLNIPHYERRALVSISPRDGEEERLYGKLVDGGLASLDEKDIEACDMILRPDFSDGGRAAEPLLSVVHRSGDTAFVSTTIDDVTARLGFTLA